MIRIVLSILAVLLLFSGCAKQPVLSEPEPDAPATVEKRVVAPNIHSVRAMVVGLDQYPNDDVMVIRTEAGQYVVGPGVSAKLKKSIHERLTEAFDRVVTILYVEREATGDTVAHKRVTSLDIEGETYLLPY